MYGINKEYLIKIKYTVIPLVIAASTLLMGCTKDEAEKVSSIDDIRSGEGTEIAIENSLLDEPTDVYSEESDMDEDKGILYRDLQEKLKLTPVNVDTDNETLQGTCADSIPLMPILQNPTKNGVTVQWFTDGETEDNRVVLYEDINLYEDGDESNVVDIMLNATPTRTIEAKSYKLTRMRGGRDEKTCNDPTISADIYKHVAYVDGLPEYHGYVSERVAYRITSAGLDSPVYTLAACPAEGTPLKILLTSDFQGKNMCAANIQKVYEETGHVDAVLCDGDIVDVTDRVYDWFFADNAFWRIMTGTAHDEINGEVYYGAPLLQEAPIYTAIGNHDVMGVYDTVTDLSVQFNNPSTREHAKELWNSTSKSNQTEEEFIRDHSYNTISYEEMFELPNDDGDTDKYYMAKLGDLALISLDVSRVWRLPQVGVMGKYSELPGANTFGYGDFIFEPVSKGSEQINFYEKKLSSEVYKNAKYKMVMYHSEGHSLGGNSIPAFTDPVEGVVTDTITGLPMKTYNYPRDNDYIHNVIEPMAEEAKTDIIFNAHSHVWNRFKTDKGMNILETSNVGNTYGCYDGDKTRESIPSVFIDGDDRAGLKSAYNEEDYPKTGDLFNLEPIEPNVARVPDGTSYLESNSLTVFSLLDTKDGVVNSYYFDTQNAGSKNTLFDSFKISRD